MVFSEKWGNNKTHAVMFQQLIAHEEQNAVTWNSTTHVDHDIMLDAKEMNSWKPIPACKEFTSLWEEKGYIRDLSGMERMCAYSGCSCCLETKRSLILSDNPQNSLLQHHWTALEIMPISLYLVMAKLLIHLTSGSTLATEIRKSGLWCSG